MESGPAPRVRFRGVNGKYTRDPNKPPKQRVPRRKIGGKLVPIVSRPSPDMQACHEFIKELRDMLGVRLYAISSADWLKLMDLLPVCECGYVVSPRRVMHTNRAQAYCRDHCKLRRDHRIQDVKRRARNPDDPRFYAGKKQALALARDIGQ